MTENCIRATVEEIASGKFAGQYLVYARKSTDEPDSQKNSIAYQRQENVAYAQRAGLPIAPLTLHGFCTDGLISERHSAFKEGSEIEFGENGRITYRIERPKFHQLAAFLAQGRFKGVVFLCWDRASRNKADEVVLRKLMKLGADLRFVLATYDPTSSGELHMDIDGMFAAHHSRVTSEKVRGAIKKLRAEGKATHKAPVGYLNPGSSEWKPFDPERMPIVRGLFERADATDSSLADLQRWAVAQGFTMPPTRRPRTKLEQLDDEERDERANLEKISRLPTGTQIHKILVNPYYAGFTWGNGGWAPSTSHEPIVSKALFDRVQRKLGSRRTSLSYDRKLPYPYRGFIRHMCGRVYTPYAAKGSVYYGARCDRSCPYGLRSISQVKVERSIADELGKLVVSPDALRRLDRAGAEIAKAAAQQRLAEREVRERKARKLREDLAYIADNRLALLKAGVYDPAALVSEQFRLERALERPSGQQHRRVRMLPARRSPCGKFPNSSVRRNGATNSPNSLERRLSRGWPFPNSRCQISALFLAFARALNA
jgi:DNA invertase Pin-like site-specific DNA recombinase